MKNQKAKVAQVDKKSSGGIDPKSGFKSKKMSEQDIKGEQQVIIKNKKK